MTRRRPRDRRQIAALLAAVLSLLAGAVPARAALPSQGTGLVSDGASQIALFTADGTGVEVYDTATGDLVGQRVALPVNSTGERSTWFARGLVGGRVYLTAGVGASDEIAVADSASGSFRRLCDVPGTPPCLQFPVSLARPEIIRVGKRWMEILGPSTRRGGTTLIRYSDSGASFTQRFTTSKEERRYQELIAAGATVDLDATRVQETTRFGYRALSRGAYLLLGRNGDRRLGRLRPRLPGSNPPKSASAGYPKLSARGICASTGTRLILWDRRTRRVWTRAIPRELRSPAIACTEHGVVLASANAFSPRPPIAYSILVGPLLRWPTASAPSGWRQGPVLRPGRRVTV